MQVEDKMNYKKIIVKEGVTFFNLSDGKNIILVETNSFGGYNISSIHKPNTRTGTGFRLAEGVELTGKLINDCLSTFAPAWAYGNQQDIDSVKKYESLEDFIKHDKQFFPDLQVIDINID